MKFLNQIELVSERLKGMLADMGEDVEKWKLPMREDNGVITGLYAKVHNANAYAVINENGSSLRCSIKLTCAFFSKDSCGISFELTHAFHS